MSAVSSICTIRYSQRCLANWPSPSPARRCSTPSPISSFSSRTKRGNTFSLIKLSRRRSGEADKAKLIGKTAADVFPGPLGKNYYSQDVELIATGEPLLNELELHAYPTMDEGWCLTTKLPLKGRHEKCVGLVGISRDLHAPTEDYRDVAEALRKAQAQIDSPMTVDCIASSAGLSAFQFDRRIREVFHVSASQLILKFRMDRIGSGCTTLSSRSRVPVLDCGYADQSSFTRQFGRIIGLTPAEFRKRYQY